MKHARRDYDRIQDPEGRIPPDEPVFLLRGQDQAAPAAVRKWAAEAAKLGASGDILEAAITQASRMDAWQREVCRKVPDMPLTLANLSEMFSGEVPREVFDLIFRSPDGTTVGEIREKVRLLAAARKIKGSSE